MRGRTFEQHTWYAVCDELQAVDEDRGLTGEELARLATAAYMCGRLDRAADAWTRAHCAFIDVGNVPASIRSALAHLPQSHSARRACSR